MKDKRIDIKGLKFSLLLVLLVCLGSPFFTSCAKKDALEQEEPEEQVETPEETPEETEEPETTDLEIYIPNEFASLDFDNSESKWCWERSKQSEHFIVFWEAGFGLDPNASTVSEDLRVDIDDLLEKSETFFDINVNQLGFAELGNGTSNLDKYKMEIFLFYTTDWMAFGGGVDNVVGALWINPSTVHPVGQAIAHEIGHSFQYQTYCDLLAYGGIADDGTRGFRYPTGSGSTFWEQCAQWQSFRCYPDYQFSVYDFTVYTDNYFRHFDHEWYRYASYFLQTYWTDKHGDDFIGKMWREAVYPEDPIEAYMRMTDIMVDELNTELYDAASKFVTWDIDALRTYGADYIGKLTYKFYQLQDGTYQVAYGKCPGTTGYNVIPLNVPDAGTTVSTTFTGLAPGSALAADDPGAYIDNGTTLTTTSYNPGDASVAGWRYGYVALLESGARVYGDMNSMDGVGTADATFTVPESCARLWFVVQAAPSTYEPHEWDEQEQDDLQWPYTVKFENTNILGNITIAPDATPEDLTLTYNLSFPATTNGDYTGTSVNLQTNGDITQVAEALTMQPSELDEIFRNAGESAQEGTIAFAAVESDGSLNYSTTANGYGFWYSGQGDVTNWGNDSKIFVEFSLSNMEFTVGQFPDGSQAGDTYTVKEAFVYTKDGIQYKVTFVFYVTIQ